MAEIEEKGLDSLSIIQQVIKEFQHLFKAKRNQSLQRARVERRQFEFKVC